MEMIAMYFESVDLKSKIIYLRNSFEFRMRTWGE